VAGKHDDIPEQAFYLAGSIDEVVERSKQQEAMAIPAHLRLEFVTPERALAQNDVDEVVIPGETGDLGVLPGHAPLLTALRPGEMWYRKGSEKFFAFVAGGFAEVVGDRVSILARVAEHSEEIDLERAEAAKRRAEDLLAKPSSDTDLEQARVALRGGLARLDIARPQRPRCSPVVTRRT